MAMRTLTDEAGCGVEVLEWRGVFLQVFSDPSHLETIQAMDFRPDDILIATYSKSGTHWLFEMVKTLLAGKAEPVNEPLGFSYLEHPTCKPEVLQVTPSPRVLITHLPIEKLPPGVARSGCKVLVMERGIKDVVCSLFAMVRDFKKGGYNGTFNNFASMFLQGKCAYNSYFDHLKGYRQANLKLPNNPICILSYEEMKKDHVGQLGRLSAFLGLDSSPQLLADIAALTDFKSMQQYKTHKDDTSMFKSGKNGFYRKGEVGDWKNWFTVAQSEVFDAEYLRQMGEPYYDYSLDS